MGVENKKISLLGIFSFIFLILFISFIFATTTINNPVANGNYSTTMNFSIETDLPEALNVTVYYNASGGATNDVLTYIINTSASQTIFENATLDISGLSDAATYNFTVIAYNETDSETASSVSGITVDNTPPNVSTFYNFVDGGSYSGIQIINVSVSDNLIGLDSVYFNATNISGVQVAYNNGSCSGGYCILSFNTSFFSDGNYNLTVYANDSLNNQNHTELITVTLDNTDPSITLSASSTTQNSITLTSPCSDVTSGIASCVLTSSSGSVSDYKVSGLGCGKSYTLTVNAQDAAGNTASSNSDFSTLSCSGGGVSSSNINTWTKTYVEDSDELTAEGVTRQLKAQHRIRVKVKGESHHVGVKSLTTTSAVIEIASDPVSVNLNVGEDAKVDLDNNGFYDLYVVLNSIENNKADVSVMKISESIPEGQGSVSTTGEELTGQEPEEDNTLENESSTTWIWIVIIILVLIAAGAGAGMKKKR